MPEPFDLAGLKAKVEQWRPDFSVCVPVSDVLELHAALVRYRQWLVEREESDTPATVEAGLSDALAAFDRAVRL